MPSLLKPCTTWTSLTNRQYSSVSTACKLDLYVPNNSWSSCPLIIWVHGGGWYSGDKADNIQLMAPLVKRGFAVASINYRFSTQAIWPAQIIDVKSAVRYLRANAAVNRLYPAKMGMWGGSAGGHLALMAGCTNGVAEFDKGSNLTISSSVQAVLADYPPTDLLRWCQESPDGADDLMVAQLLGAWPTMRPDRAAHASPVTWASLGDAPTALWHGDADTLVPLSQSEEMHDKLLAANVPTSLEVVPGMGHGDVAYYTTARLTAVGDYFDGHLQS